MISNLLNKNTLLFRLDNLLLEAKNISQEEREFIIELLYKNLN